jgi:hypothetical protein
VDVFGFGPESGRSQTVGWLSLGIKEQGIKREDSKSYAKKSLMWADLRQ